MPPKAIGPYRVLETLGSGGAGTVYRARDRRTNDEVALKLLSTGPSLDDRAARRLVREFETLADLAHPNVVKVFDVDDDDEDDGTFGLNAFAEEAPSEDLASFHGAGAGDDSDSDDLPVDPRRDLARKPSTSASTSTRAAPPRMADLNRPERMGRLKDAMLQVCEALAYIHGHGLVHRDLKPSNIMVDDDRQVRLMDFGLAKFLADDAGITADGKLVGTYRYMAPEQILGEPLDGRSDLYSLGVILYELISGRPPFDAKTPHELWRQVLETEAPPLLALNLHGDPQLARVAHRLIRKEPDDRFQTAEEVYEALSE
ncbi:MAG: serine/threonine protein kinase [Myxococcaceae bacterium]|nr:MAG: serine/threonine protein kinase [Myxococcaceae bacterium]